MNKKRDLKQVIKRSFFILLGTINRNSVFDVTCKDKSCQHLENSSHVHVITVLIFRSKVDATQNTGVVDISLKINIFLDDTLKSLEDLKRFVSLST